MAATRNSRAAWQNFWKCHRVTVPCDTSEDKPKKGEQLPSSLTRTTVVTSQQNAAISDLSLVWKWRLISYLDILISLCKTETMCCAGICLSVLPDPAIISEHRCAQVHKHPMKFFLKTLREDQEAQRTLAFELSERWGPKKWELRFISILQFLYTSLS